MVGMAADSTELSSFTDPSRFVTDLPTPPERFLARVLAHALENNWRSPDEFLIHFPPRDILRGLAGQHALRAAILIGAAGVHTKLAEKKALETATEDLELALAEGLTDAAHILGLFPIDDRVRFLNKQRLWSFVSGEGFWQSTTTDQKRSVERMAFLLTAALQEDLITLQQLVEGIGFAEIAERLPPARLRHVMRRALEIGHTGRPLDAAALLEEVRLSELLEVIPLDHVFRQVIAARIAVPSGFGDAGRKPPKSVIPQLDNPQEDARVESLFDALQSSGEQAATSKYQAEQAVESPQPAPSPAKLQSSERADVPATASSERSDASAPAGDVVASPPGEEQARERVSARLAQIGRLPPGHEGLPLSILLTIDSMYDKLFMLTDDEARERCIYDCFPDEQDLRLAMLALVDLLDPTINTARTTIQECDIDSLVAVVVFEERLRHERAAAASKPAVAPVHPPRSTTPAPPPPKPYHAPESGTRAKVVVPPPLPKPASRQR